MSDARCWSNFPGKQLNLHYGVQDGFSKGVTSSLDSKSPFSEMNFIQAATDENICFKIKLSYGSITPNL